MKLRLKADGPQQDSIRDLDNTSFNLLVFGQSTPESAQLPNLLRIYEVPSEPGNDAALARAGIPRRSFYLVRPDGYIALCGQEVNSATLAKYLRTRPHFAR
jgi:hypothetical protein